MVERTICQVNRPFSTMQNRKENSYIWHNKCHLVLPYSAKKSDEFDEWRAIRKSFPFQSFPINTFPMKATINSSKFCAIRYRTKYPDLNLTEPTVQRLMNSYKDQLRKIPLEERSSLAQLPMQK